MIRTMLAAGFLLAGCTTDTYNLNPFVVCGPGVATGYALVRVRPNGDICQAIPWERERGSWSNPIYVRPQ